MRKVLPSLALLLLTGCAAAETGWTGLLANRYRVHPTSSTSRPGPQGGRA